MNTNKLIKQFLLENLDNCSSGQSDYYEEYESHLDYDLIFNLSEDINILIETLPKDKLDFDEISANPNLSLDNISKYKEVLEWDLVSNYSRYIDLLIMVYPELINQVQAEHNCHCGSDAIFIE